MAQTLIAALIALFTPRPITEQDAPDAAPQPLGDQDEMDTAVTYLCDRLDAICGRNGRDIAEYVEAPEFGTHAEAYRAAIREGGSPATIHDRAAALFMIMIGRQPRPARQMNRLITTAYGLDRSA